MRFTYQYPNTCLPVYALRRHINAFKRFLDVDVPIDVYAPVSKQASDEHQTLALAHFYVYLMYSVLHDASFTCRVFTSGDFKHFKGDVLDNSYGYRMFPLNNNPSSLPSVDIRFAAVAQYPHSDSHITVSPLRPICFPDGTCVVTQPKPNGCKTLRIGTHEDAIDVYVSNNVWRIIRNHILARPDMSLYAPRVKPSHAPVYHVNSPAHTPARRARITLGSTISDVTPGPFNSAKTIAMNIALCFLLTYVFSYAITYFSAPKLRSAYLIIWLSALFLPDNYITTTLLVNSYYAVESILNYGYDSTFIGVMMVRICFGFIPVRQVILHLLLTLASFTFLIYYFYEPAVMLYHYKANFDQFTGYDKFYRLVDYYMNGTIPALPDPPTPSYILLLRAFAMFWNDYLRKPTALLLAYIQLVRWARSILASITFRITSESTGYFNFFGQYYIQKDLDEPITILPLKFINGYCSDRYAITQKPDFKFQEYMPMSKLDTYVIIGSTTHGIRLRQQGFERSTIFPVVYGERGNVGHLMMASLTRDYNTDKVQQFIHNWNDSFDARYKLIVGQRLFDREQVVSPGDIFVDEVFTLTGTTYRVSHFAQCRLSIPASIATYFLTSPRPNNTILKTIAAENKLTPAVVSHYSKIIRQLAVSGQVFVPGGVSTLEVTPIESLNARVSGIMSVARLTTLSVRIWTLVSTYFLFQGVSPLYSLTYAIQTASSTILYCLNSLVLHIPALVRRLNSLLFSHVLGSSEQQHSPLPRLALTSLRTKSPLFSDKPNYPTLLSIALNLATRTTFAVAELPLVNTDGIDTLKPFCQLTSSSVKINILIAKDWYTCFTPDYKPLSSAQMTTFLTYLKALMSTPSPSWKLSPLSLSNLTPLLSKYEQSTTSTQNSMPSSPTSSTQLNTKSTPCSQPQKVSPLPTPVSASTLPTRSISTSAQRISQVLTDASVLNSANLSRVHLMISCLFSQLSAILNDVSSNTSPSMTKVQSTRANGVLHCLQFLSSVLSKSVSVTTESSLTTSTPEMITSYSMITQMYQMLLSPASALLDSTAELKVLLATLEAYASALATTSPPKSQSPTSTEPSVNASLSQNTSVPPPTSLQDSSPIMTPPDTPPSSPTCSSMPSEPCSDGVADAVPLESQQTPSSGPSPMTTTSMSMYIMTTLITWWCLLRDWIHPFLFPKCQELGGVNSSAKMSPTKPALSNTFPHLTSQYSLRPVTLITTTMTDHVISLQNFYVIAMPSETIRETVTVKTKNNRRNRRRRNARSSARFTNRAHTARSVRAAAMLETTSRFARSVFDPAHLAEYDPMGIPDIHNGRTLCMKSLQTESLSTLIDKCSFYYVQDSGYAPYTPVTGDLIEKIYVIQDDNPFYAYYMLVKGKIATSSRDIYGVLTFTSTFVANAETDKMVRLFARSMTIEQIGPYAERGGYLSLYRLDNSTINVSDKVVHSLSAKDFEPNLIDQQDGIRGVYSILRPSIRQNYTQWHSMDESVDYSFSDANGVLIATKAINGTNASSPSMSTNVVQLVPPQPFVIGSTTFNFRITSASAVEYESSAQIGNLINPEPSVIDYTIGLMAQCQSFYPASFNDLRKIARKLKQTYVKNKDLVEAALDAITPDRRRAIVEFLDTLATRV